MRVHPVPAIGRQFAFKNFLQLGFASHRIREKNLFSASDPNEFLLWC
jgi:hypothetical protein